MGNNQPNKYRNFMIGAASTALVASAVAPIAASAADFSDVKGNTHESAINALVQAGVINGYADGTFQPNKTLTRSDVVKMMGKWLVSLDYKVPTDYKTNPRFKDLTSKSNDELLKYAALVKDNGVFNGYADGTLGAGLDITRENMAIVLVRAYDAIHKTDLVTLVKETEFDKDVTDLAKAKAEARPYIDVLDYFDITNPVAPQFNPKNTTTRGQFASFLYKTSNVNVEEEADTEAPKLVYTGEKTLNVEYAAEFTAPVVTATDNVDEKVEVTSVITNEAGERLTAIDTKVPGTYKVTYSAVDAAGNNAEDLVLTVVVAENPVFEVVSVAAINATQVQVQFNKVVDKATVLETTGTLKSGVFNFRTLETPAKTITANNAKGSLSEDGKTLTITAQSEVFEGRYDITVDGVKDKDGKVLKKYEVKNLDLGKDTTAPAIKNVEKVNASTVKVLFSEPLSVPGNWTFKNTRGEAVTVTPTGFTAGDSAVTLVIDSNVAAGTEITATVLGAKDQVNNLINPNPSSVTFTKGVNDGVKPEVVAVTAKGLNKFEVKFSEEVQGFVKEDISIGGTVLSHANDKVIQDTTDKTKYEVTLNSPLTAGFHKIEVKDVTDLSGEILKDFSRLVEFKADTAKPVFVSSEVVVDPTTKEEKLVLTFDKEVAGPYTLAANTSKISVTELNKDLVTTNGTFTKGQFIVNPLNNKQLEVVLNTVKFKPTTGSETDLAKGATYTLKFAKDIIVDTNSPANKADAFEITFKRGEDGTPSSTAKPTVTSVVAANDDNSKIDVKFDKAVDGVTATAVANYSIPGLEIEKATLHPVADGSQTVTLTLKKGTNTLSGERDITIQNVKAKDANVMDTVTKTVTLTENIAPTLVSAKFTNTNSSGNVDKITLTFSEAVKTTDATTDIFEIFVGSSTVATTVSNVDLSSNDNNKVVLTVTNPLTPAQIAEGITVKAKTAGKVIDLNKNTLDFNSIKAEF